MANTNLTQVEIDALVALIKKHAFLASAGTDDLNPLAAAPSVEGDVALKDTTLYETGEEIQASFISKNNVKVTLKTRNITKALTLLSAFKKGDNIYASANKKALTLVPITSDATAETITFTDAYLQPGLSFAPGENDTPQEATLVYICKPDATTGKPFTFAAGA